METFLLGLELVNFLGIIYLAVQIRKDRDHDCLEESVDALVETLLESVDEPPKKRGRPKGSKNKK